MKDLVWKGRTLRTIGDLMRHGIDACDTPEEAQAFMALYRDCCPHANANIGYLSGYYSPDERQRIQEWFTVEHPIFGKKAPTAREALLAGMAIGGGARQQDVAATFGTSGEGSE